MYYLCVLNFVTTSWDDTICQSLNLKEIIQFTSILYKVDNDITKIAEFNHYVKPLINPVLSDFCIETTGITQEIVDKSKDFRETYEDHHEWLIKQINHKDTIYMLTNDNLQLKNILTNETIMKNIKFYNIYRKNLVLQNKQITLTKDNLQNCYNIANLYIETNKNLSVEKLILLL